MLLPETLRQMAASFGPETAYTVVDGGSVTFTEWDGGANRLARGLVEAGIRPDDRVALHLSTENALRWIVAYAAIHRSGAVAVPLNPRLAPAEVGHMLAHAGAAGVIADGPLVSQDLALAGPGGAAPTIALVVDATPGGPAPVAPDAVGGGTRLVAWGDVSSPDAAALQVPRADDDLADILYTSGTTGRPKGVAVRHVNASLVPPMDPSWSGGAWLHASPMFTFAGLAFVYNPMKLGLRGIYMPKFDAGRWLEVVAAERPVAVFLVPAMTHLLLDHPGFADADLSSIQICAIGSAPLAPFVIELLQEQDARRDGQQQLRDDRGGLGLLHHPQGGGPSAPGLGGSTGAPGRGAHRRPGRRGAPRRRGRRGPAQDPGSHPGVLRRPRGHRRDLGRRVAA